MDVRVRLGPGLSQVSGVPLLNVTLPSGATVHDLLTQLRDTYPEHATRLRSALPVVRGSYVTADHELESGEEVALLMPVSGGSEAR